MGLNLALFYVVRDMGKEAAGFIVIQEDQESINQGSGQLQKTLSQGSENDDRDNRADGVSDRHYANSSRQSSRVLSVSSVALEESERFMRDVRSISVA